MGKAEYSVNLKDCIRRIMNRKNLLAISFVCFTLFIAVETVSQQQTYCNPINLDYGYCPIPNFTEQGRHRATADPVITLFKENYYLFSTNQWGYWWSDDMYTWNFVERFFLKPWHNVYDELCAPGTLVLGDTLLLIGSTHTKEFPIWMSTEPTGDNWKEAVEKFEAGAWDPAFFEDDDGRIYCYWGSSNAFPLYGQEISRKTLQPIGDKIELIYLNDSLHGWERFGEYNDNTFLKPFMEGAWVNKNNGKYYLQYGAPGTEFSGYADGVYISQHPLGPFKYQQHNPFSYKPGGFARGSGHGATYQDLWGNWWHVSTVVIGVKNNFERRIGIWPAGFDNDDLLFCNTAYGDYPHYLPTAIHKNNDSQFTGWMLLNYNKPVRVSSSLRGHPANMAVDEDIKTWWSAASGSPGEWFITDLGQQGKIKAIQINYADQDASLMGKYTDIFHRYKVYQSDDGNVWEVLIDKSENDKDVPHDYIEFSENVSARYIKMENLHMPTGKFALSGFRVFGKIEGETPARVNNFNVLRGDHERRNAWLKWEISDDASGYMIYFGIGPDKLYSSVMVLGKNDYYLSALNIDQEYFFQIEAFNESGIGPKSDIIHIR
jgi:hypothetical protein